MDGRPRGLRPSVAGEGGVGWGGVGWAAAGGDRAPLRGSLPARRCPLFCANVRAPAQPACRPCRAAPQVNALREIQALRRLAPHPGIIELRAVVFDCRKGRLALVFELLAMNLYELIRGASGLPRAGSAATCCPRSAARARR